MKRPWKILLIVLSSILGIVVLLCIALSIILFNAGNLASVVEGQLNKQEQLEFNIGEADLVFFRTFPEVSLRIRDFGLADRVSSGQILNVREVYAAIDLKRFLREKELVVRKVSLEYVDTDLSLLMDAFSADENEEVLDDADSGFSLPFGLMDISSVSATDLNLRYAEAGGVDAAVEHMNVSAALNTHANKMQGVLNVEMPSVTLAMADTLYCEALPVAVKLPFTADLDSMSFRLDNAVLSVSSFDLAMDGRAAVSDTGTFDLDMEVAFDDWNLSGLLALIPESVVSLPDGLESLQGVASLTSDIKGVYAEGRFPLLEGSVRLASLGIDKGLLPMSVKDGALDVCFTADLNDGGSTDIVLRNLSAKTGKSSIAVSGSGSDVLGNPGFDLKVASLLEFEDIMPLLPESLGMEAEGSAILDMTAKGTLKQLTDLDLDKLISSAEIDFRDLHITYSDTIFVDSPDLSVAFALNGRNRYGQSAYSDFAKEVHPRGGATIGFTSLDVTVGRAMSAMVTESEIKVGLDRLPLGNVTPKLYCDFNFDGLEVVMDTIDVAVFAPKGSVALLPSIRKGGQGRYLVRYASDAMYAHLGKVITVDADNIIIAAEADRDSSAADVLSQWQPVADVDFRNGNVTMAMMDVPVEIPAINFRYSGDTLDIHDGSFVMGNSDFKLHGAITDIRKYLFDDGLLAAKLDFESQNTDVDQLLGYFSGFGVDESEIEPVEDNTDSEPNEESASEGDPFMVPRGIDFTLNTKIGSASAFNTTINNIGGEVTVKDGVAVLKQLGFTSDAARMQLTAMYKSPRRNHLFAGIDFHLIDIEIDKLVRMIPQVDTIVPMLKSFAGQAEFHLAVETNLNSKYELKKSTLLGAASIEGKNLVVLDSETFDMIADMLSFKKSQKNVIDSLLVDMTVFRNEVDIYPFIVSMDKYKLVLSGRHNLDMSFNYHLDCLSPIRLGLDVKGRLGDLKFGITPTRYKNLFIPERRNDVQERTVKLMNLINTSLKEKVVE